MFIESLGNLGDAQRLLCQGFSSYSAAALYAAVLRTPAFATAAPNACLLVDTCYSGMATSLTVLPEVLRHLDGPFTHVRLNRCCDRSPLCLSSLPFQYSYCEASSSIREFVRGSLQADLLIAGVLMLRMPL